MQFKRLVANNQLFALLAKLLEGGKSVLIAFAVISLYSSQEFGTYSLAIAIGSIFAILAEFRLMGILIRLLSRYPSLHAVILRHAILLNMGFAVLGIVLVSFSTFFVDDLLFQCVMLYSLSFVFKFGRCLRAELLSTGQNNKVALSEVISGLVSLSLIGCALMYNADIRFITALRTLDFLVLSLMFLQFSNLSVNKLLQGRVSPRVFGFLIKKSLPLVLSGAAMIIFQRVDLIVINTVWSTEHAGIYASATTIATVFALSAMVFSESLAPKLFKSSAVVNNHEYDFGQLILAVGAGMSILSLLSANLIVTHLLADEYQAALNSLLILGLTPMLTSMGAFAGQVIIKRKLERFVFKKSLLACVITIALNILLVPIFGIEGGAVSTVIGLLFANYLSHWLIPELRPIFEMQNRVLINLNPFYKRRLA